MDEWKYGILGWAFVKFGSFSAYRICCHLMQFLNAGGIRLKLALCMSQWINLTCINLSQFVLNYSMDLEDKKMALFSSIGWIKLQSEFLWLGSVHYATSMVLIMFPPLIKNLNYTHPVVFNHFKIWVCVLFLSLFIWSKSEASIWWLITDPTLLHDGFPCFFSKVMYWLLVTGPANACTYIGSFYTKGSYWIQLMALILIRSCTKDLYGH